jgi:sulfur relay (sulfurtransferase) DsrF/TusC family protein
MKLAINNQHTDEIFKCKAIDKTDEILIFYDQNNVKQVFVIGKGLKKRILQEIYDSVEIKD